MSLAMKSAHKQLIRKQSPKITFDDQVVEEQCNTVMEDSCQTVDEQVPIDDDGDHHNGDDGDQGSVKKSGHFSLLLPFKSHQESLPVCIV